MGTFPTVSSIIVAREEAERLRKEEGEEKKKKREEGEGINNRFILEVGASAVAPGFGGSTSHL